MNTTGSEAGSTQDELLIRRLTPADAGAYRALRLRGLAEHPDAFTSSAEDEAKKSLAATEARIAPDSPDAVFGAFAGAVLAGVVGLAREARAKNRHKATVFGMYVAPEFARRGVGRALIRHVVAVAQREPGLEQLVLTVTQTNDAARALYESEGFRSFGIEPRAIRIDGRYYDKNHMVRFLDRP
jgi:ribosomal protein S18 acetylase RimI-like enzyme